MTPPQPAALSALDDAAQFVRTFSDSPDPYLRFASKEITTLTAAKEAAERDTKIFADMAQAHKIEIEILRENGRDIITRSVAAESRVKALEAAYGRAWKSIEQFWPNVDKCFGIDFANLNEVSVEAPCILSTKEAERG